MAQKPLAIDLFSGAGGLSLGFELAGFEIVAAVEQHAHAAVTYALNHPSTAMFCTPVQRLDFDVLRRHLGLRRGELSAIIGGPPCQGFSESNRRTRNLANVRNHLYRYVIRAVEVFRPRWVIVENVAGILTLRHGEILRRIIRELNSIGYAADSHLLNAADYGVPQHRRRVFIVAARGRTPPPVKQRLAKKRPPPSVRDALSDLPRLSTGSDIDIRRYAAAPSEYASRLRGTLKEVSGNLVSANSSEVRERYKYIRAGGNWEDIPSYLMRNYTDPSRCHTGIYRRLQWDSAATVIGNFRKNMLLHPAQNRGLSVREAARLQSFPDWYSFSGSIGLQQQQVADAVPPLLAKAVARAVLKCHDE